MNYSRILVGISERGDVEIMEIQMRNVCMYIAGEKHIYPLVGWLIKYWRGRLGACCIVA